MGCSQSSAKPPQPHTGNGGTVLTDGDNSKPAPVNTDAELKTVRLEIIEAEIVMDDATADAVKEAAAKAEKPGLKCSVEIAGKPDSRVETEAAEDVRKPKWNHRIELQGYRVGETLQLTLPHGLGRVNLEAEKVRAGFIGSLGAVGSKKGVQVTIKVDVNPVDGTVSEKASHLKAEAADLIADVKGGAAAFTEAKVEILEVAQAAVEDVQELGQEAEQLAEEAAAQTMEVVEDQATTCSCWAPGAPAR